MPKRAEPECQRFFASRKSLLLSSHSPDGVLEASAVPFIQSGEAELTVLVSELAVHTRNILSMKEGECLAGLLAADEADTAELFARERMHMQLSPLALERESQAWMEAMRGFEGRFGEVVSVLKGLPDFHCFRLRIESGRYVRGFGEAYGFEKVPCQALRRLTRA